MDTQDTPTPTDPREEKPEIVHGFTLPSGCNAAYLDHWKEFAKFYSEKIGGEAHPRDSHANMLLEFYVEGGFQEFQRNQSTTSTLAAEIAELKAQLKDWLRIGPVSGMSMAQYVVASESQLATLRAELEAANAREEFLKSKGLTVGTLKASNHEPKLAYVIEPESELCDLRYIHEIIDLKRELEAARKELKSPRFHVPDGLLDNFRRYIPELPPCEIVEDGVMVGKDALIELVNRLKNGMADDLNTALAAKDAAERLINALESIPKTHAIGLAPSGTWQYFGENGNAAKPTKTARELLEVIAALTPAPTQEPPAGGVTADISTVEKERDHWKATAQLHYNARLELERERDRKGGDSSCAPSNEPTLPDLSKCASNSPADVPSEGRGEWIPIETAPDDKTEVILGWKKLVCSGHWDEKLNAWVTSYGTYRGSFNPTHWQPLPPPPMLPTEGSGA